MTTMGHGLNLESEKGKAIAMTWSNVWLVGTNALILLSLGVPDVAS